MKLANYVSLVIGVAWLAGDVYLVISNVILRETRIGALAALIERLPPSIGNAVFILLWVVILFGWAPLVLSGVKPLWKSSMPQGPS